MRPMTVIQLLPALAGGGVERTTLEVGEALVKAGHRSIVVSAGGRLVAPLVAAGSEHVALDIGRKSPVVLRHVPALRRLFADADADIVHARSRLPAWLARRALQGMDAPRPHFITSVHGLNSAGWYSSILTRGERVICVSPTVRAHVLRHWPGTDPDRLEVVEPGIDPAVFCREPVRAGEPEDGSAPADPRQRLLLMPGRGTRLKGHAAAIALLAAVRAAGVDARLWLPGSREPGRQAYLAELEARARALGVTGFLQLDPPTADIVAAYRQSDLVLQLSSRPEAFGRTVVEALAVGKPVVGWAHGGVGELLGRYFPRGQVTPGDADALLATTLALLADPRPPARVLPQTLATMQAQTLGIYDSIIA